jgi:hypothetical protein
MRIPLLTRPFRDRLRAHGRRSATLLALATAWLVAGCGGEREAHADQPAATAANAAPQEQWPTGTTDERIRSLASHIGGFSTAMVEVGYRHNELYWAGTDANWRLAGYHADKIRDAIEKGIERRPGRADSARRFLDETLPAFDRALEREDTAAFAAAFDRLTRGCNGCHSGEDVEFIEIRTPERRIYPVHAP